MIDRPVSLALQCVHRTPVPLTKMMVACLHGFKQPLLVNIMVSPSQFLVISLGVTL
jgi:hypothetical protein